MINLAWSPIDGAAGYRFLLRDVAAGDIALRSGSLGEPAYELDCAELDPEKQYEWALAVAPAGRREVAGW